MEEARAKLAASSATKEKGEGKEEDKGPLTMTQLLAKAGLDLGTSASGSAAVETVIKDSGARVGKYAPEEAATRVQAQYRGYMTRRAMQGRERGRERQGTAGFARSATGEEEEGKGGAWGGMVVEGEEGGKGLPLVEAEEAMVKCLRDTHGVGAPPDLRPTFMALDRQGKGSVNRKQFAHALRQHPALHGLSALHLRAFMDFFDASPTTDGTAIDYRAFLLFAGTATDAFFCTDSMNMGP